MNEFGRLLRSYRVKCADPESGRTLTQERLGEIIGQELDLETGYTGAAVSDWEWGNIKIHKDDRRLFVNLIRIFYKCDGLKTPTEARTLLWAGNYRGLNEDELQ